MKSADYFAVILHTDRMTDNERIKTDKPHLFPPWWR